MQRRWLLFLFALMFSMMSACTPQGSAPEVPSGPNPSAGASAQPSPSALATSGTQVLIPPAVTDTTILLGAPNALSGTDEFAGKETTVGVNTYVQSVNAEGGVFGRKIKVLQCDDKYEVEGALRCFKSLTDQGVFALTGIVGSALLAKYVPLCMDNKIPLVGAYSGPSFVGEPAKRYIFTVRPGYRDEEHQFVEHMWNDVGVRKIGIIYQNDAYGADHLNGLSEALKARGATLTGFASYARNTNNLTDAFDSVRKANPQAVSLAANNTQCTLIIQMARKAGWRPIFYINSGANVDAFIRSVGKDGNGVLVSEVVPSPTHTNLPLIARYVKALHEYFPTEQPCFTSLRGYIDALVVVEGLKRAGKDVTREKFVNGLDSIHDLEIGLGPGMEVTYSPADHIGFHRFVFGTLQDGDIQTLSTAAEWRSLAPKE